MWLWGRGEDPLCTCPHEAFILQRPLSPGEDPWSGHSGIVSEADPVPSPAPSILPRLGRWHLLYHDCQEGQLVYVTCLLPPQFPTYLLWF